MDNNNISGPGRTKSRSYTISIISTQQKRDEVVSSEKETLKSLSEILKEQIDNQKKIRQLIDKLVPEGIKPDLFQDLLGPILTQQVHIRKDTVKASEHINVAFYSLKTMLRALVNDQMLTVISQLEETDPLSKPAELKRQLQTANTTMDTIIKKFQEIIKETEFLADKLKIQDIVTSIDDIIRKQKDIRSETAKLTPQDKSLLFELADREDKLRYVTEDFKERLSQSIKDLQVLNPVLAIRFKEMQAALDKEEIIPDMVKVKNKLKIALLKPALDMEDKIIRALERIAHGFNKAILDGATEQMKDLISVIKQTKDRLEKMTEIEESVTTLTQDISSVPKDKLSVEQKEALKEMARLQEKMGQVIENIANDLSLLPQHIFTDT
ncbi:MAG: hypothetical protein KAX15_08395, partial [Candidatus Omnitrophica bacterium]|nr:hypothetical protein [Candidatus Omnitrophota bacterium]